VKVFESTYDPEISCCLLAAYKNGATPPEKEELLTGLIDQLAPLVRVVTATEMNPTIGEHTLDVIKLEALEYVFFFLSDEYIPPHVYQDSTVFTRYFWTVIKRGVLASYSRTYPHLVYDFLNMGHETPQAGRLKTHNDTETAIYMNQFYKVVLRVAVRDIRFDGKEKKACIYIGRCLLGLLSYHPLSARFRFKIPKERTMFLVQYMEHLLKATAHEIKRVDEAIGANDQPRV